MVKPQVNMLCSSMSHMPLLYVWRDSGVTRPHGFELKIDITGVRIPGQRFIKHDERAPLLLDGTYDMLSGLHIEPYYYRAKGDKRLILLDGEPLGATLRVPRADEQRSDSEVKTRGIHQAAHNGALKHDSLIGSPNSSAFL